MFELDGVRVLVAGGSSGVGLAAARLFSPGVIDTPWWNWMPEDQKREAFKKFAAAAPAGRVGRPEDVAESIVFLIGNSFMTGCVLECDGGLRLIGHSL